MGVRSRTVTPARLVVLEALLDLPLGVSTREIARHIGRASHDTVEGHVARLKRTGHVEVIKRGYQKRRVIVPVRMRLSDTEREWLKLGTTTARAIVIVARANGRPITSGEVAKALGWTRVAALYHLQRAKRAGLLDAKCGTGYTLLKDGPGLSERYLIATQWIAKHGRQASCIQVAQGLGWNYDVAKYHLAKAVKAGLLTIRYGDRDGAYSLAPGAARIDWNRSNLAPA